jgi:hypothetical protein
MFVLLRMFFRSRLGFPVIGFSLLAVPSFGDTDGTRQDYRPDAGHGDHLFQMKKPASCGKRAD